MQNPWKVVAAFVGVFIAGAVFGAFFVMGIGSRLMPPSPAATVPPAAAPVATAPSTPAPAPAAAAKAVNAQAAVAQRWATLLQPPQGWQAPQLMRRYTERLGLSPEQKERVLPLIQRAAEDYRRLQASTFRETAIILQRLQQDIAKELTPEQREKLEQLEDEQREKVQKMEQRAREQKKAIGGQRAPGARNPAKADTGTSTDSTHNLSPSSSPGAPAAEAPSPATTSTSDATSEKKE